MSFGSIRVGGVCSDASGDDVESRKYILQVQALDPLYTDHGLARAFDDSVCCCPGSLPDCEGNLHFAANVA